MCKKKVIYHDKAIFILGMQNWFNIRNSIWIHYIWNRLKRKTVPPFQKMQKKQLIKLTYIHEKGRKFSKQWGIEKSLLNQMIKGITKNLKQWSANYTLYRSNPAHHLFLLIMVYWDKAISLHLSTVYSCFPVARRSQHCVAWKAWNIYYLTVYRKGYQFWPIANIIKNRLHHQWSTLETFTVKR